MWKYPDGTERVKPPAKVVYGGFYRRFFDLTREQWAELGYYEATYNYSANSADLARMSNGFKICNTFFNNTTADYYNVWAIIDQFYKYSNAV